MLIQPREIEDYPDEQGDRDLDRQPGRAALGAAADGARRPSRRRAALRRHGGLLGDARPRQRALGQRDDRPDLRDRRPGDHRRRRADPRLRPRLPGGDEADAQPDQAALRAARSTATTSGCGCTPSSPSRSGSSPSGSSRAATASPLEIDERGDARFGDDVGAGMIFVDGVEIGEPDDAALRDRRTLSADGVVIVVATVSFEDGELGRRPEVIFRGVPFRDDEDPTAPRGAQGRRRALARGAARQQGPRGRAAAAGPPRRRRRVRLQAAAPAPDGAAGGRRGLSRRRP